MAEWTLPWTNSRIARLRKMWIDGKSATEIANDLGGTTRNAVLGKAHRLGLMKTGSRRPPSLPRDIFAERRAM